MRKAIAIAALITGLTLGNPAGASAVSRSFWGIVNGPAGNASQDFTLMSQGHVGTVRFVLARNIVQSSGFSSYDPYVAELAQRGIRVLPTLVMGPGDYTPPISGSDRTSWIQFVHNAVAHYGPGGSFWQAHPGLPNVPITAWQAGNEPSLPKYWQTSSPVKDYATFLNLTHDAIRGVDSQATIVLAGLPGIVVDPPYRGWKFLAKLYGVPGAKRNFNIAAFQPYSHHVPDLRDQMGKFRRVMKRHGDGKKRVWITEFGYGSAQFNHRLNYGLDGQARMLRRTFRLFREKRRVWKVRGVIWYNWRDPAGGNSDCSFCSSSGLLRSNRQTKPSYAAFKRIAGHG